MKICTRCKVEKPLDCFGYRKAGKDSRHSGCKDCLNAISRKKWAENKNGTRDKGRAASRNYNYRNRYKMPEEVVQQLIKDANGNCSICGQHTKLFVDHCHKTQKYRGLLCRSCNLMLGYAKDKIDVLHAGAEYLRQRN